MKQLLVLLIGITLCAVMFSCAERAICPAYQSAFIHDKATLKKHFSYFGEDSLPKAMLTASKNKFLLIEPQSYRKKVRSFNTVPVKIIYPVLDDSTQLVGDVEMLAEMDVVDTVALDSAVQYQLPWKEKFNIDQEFYFHYFNDILVYPEERAQAELDKKYKKEKAENKNDEESQGFFKRIFGRVFKKKNKTKDEEEEEEEGLKEDENDEKAKKGFFGKKNKISKQGLEEQKEESDHSSTEESSGDGDDGF